MDRTFLHEAKLPAEILIGMYIALHVFVPSARAYWVANLTAWLEGLRWLLPTLNSVRRDSFKRIARHENDFTMWLFKETAWIAFEFERGRLERRGELIHTSETASFLTRLSDFALFDPAELAGYSAKFEQAA